MRNITLCGASKISDWSDSVQAGFELPRLVRRLILTTAQGVSRIVVPAGEGARLPSWDGVVDAGGSTPYVPAGQSVWELSTQKDVATKANEDYEKRSADQSSTTRTECTYICVTAREWRKKREWEQEKRKQEIWREVRAYDAHDLELWLEQAPTVHLWFSGMLGLPIDGTEPLESWWHRWRNEVQPPLTSAILLSGRSETSKRIKEWLDGPPAVLSVSAESEEEAIAVLAATIDSLSDQLREIAYARAIIVADEPSWRALALTKSQPILISKVSNLSTVNDAISNGARVLLPLLRSSPRSQNAIEVERLMPELLEEDLKKSGYKPNRARNLALAARRSLKSFRRSIATAPELQTPSWASTEYAETVVPMLFAGAWNASVKLDTEALAALAGKPYSDFEARARALSDLPDPPIRRTGNVWYLASKEDAWNLVHRAATSEQLRLFKQVAASTLSAINYKYADGNLERKTWALLGKSDRASDLLSRGIADTIALMGSGGEKSPEDERFGQLARLLVRELLGTKNLGFAEWATISDHLAQLAEAAPDEFLDAVEKDLNGEKTILKLFRGSDHAIFGECLHAELLWGLESLAWSERYLARASLLLAKLSRLDPGGRWANRPLNSLIDIFLDWSPGTSANVSERLTVIDMLRRRENEVAWTLMCNLIFEHHSSKSPTYLPAWRDWGIESDTMPPDVDRRALLHGIAGRILDETDRGIRWRYALSHVYRLPVELRQQMYAKLASIKPSGIDENALCEVWSGVRELLSICRSHRTLRDSFPRGELRLLDEQVDRLEPSSLQHRFGYLFGTRPALREGRDSDFEAYRDLLDKKQREAVQVVATQSGIAGLYEFAERVNNPVLVGQIAGQLAEIHFDEDELFSFDCSGHKEQFVLGVISGRLISRGVDWGFKFAKDRTRDWPPRQRARFIACLPTVSAEVIDIVDSYSADAIREYWQRVHWFIVSDECIDRAARCYLANNCPGQAIELLYHSLSREIPVDPQLALETLECSLSSSSQPESVSNIQHAIAELLECAANCEPSETDRLVRLEWLLLPLTWLTRPPRALHQAAAQDPAIFSEILLIAYPPRESPQSQGNEVAQQAAFRFFETKMPLPGTAATGETNPEKLLNWITEVRARFQNDKRREIADVMIGKILGNSIAYGGSTWPTPAVCEAIEQCASNDIESGLKTAVFNSRGVVTRSWQEGGEKERALFEKFSNAAERIASTYPRTASVLRDIAGGYRHDARNEDLQSELRKDLGL